MNKRTNMVDQATDGMSPVWYRGRNERFAISLITTLEWALLSSIPFVEALEIERYEIKKRLGLFPSIGRMLFFIMATLIVVKTEFLWPLLPYCLYYIFPISSRKRARILSRMINHLRSGIPLAESLDKTRIKGFPRHLVAFMRDAEKRGNVDSVIPMVARQMRYESAVRMDRMSYSTIAFTQTLLIITILWGLTLFIMPVFSAMGHDFGSSDMEGMVVYMNTIQRCIEFALGAGCVVFILTRFDSIRDRLIPCVPIIRTDWKRRQLRQLAQSVSLYLVCGYDLIASIQSSLHTIRDRVLHRRLVGFLRQVQSGEPWGPAWEGMQLEGYAYPWLIIHSSQREDPLTGFTTMAEWIDCDISRTTRLVQRWFSPCIVMALSIVVGSIAYGLHATLHMMWQAVLLP
jgi:type II secretory pathway component PulF